MANDQGTGDGPPEAWLFGSEIGANMPRATAAALIGTFALVFGATAVAAATSLNCPIAGAAYKPLAIAEAPVAGTYSAGASPAERPATSNAEG